MQQAPGLELADHVGLVRPQIVVNAKLPAIPIDVDVDVGRRGACARRLVDPHEAVDIGITRRIADLPLIVDVVFDLQCRDMRVVGFHIGKTRRQHVIDIAPRHRHRITHAAGRGGHERKAEFGNLVGVLIDVARRDAGLVIDIDLERRCDTPAFGFDILAAGLRQILTHHRDTRCDVLVELAVGIERCTKAARLLNNQLVLNEITEFRRLGCGVNDTAGRAAAEQEGRRPLQHFDLLRGEGVAGVPAGIAHAVAVDVVSRIEAANVGIVTAVAAFARAEGDARDVAQRLDIRRRVLFPHYLLRDHRNRLGGTQQRHRRSRERRLRGLIAARAGTCILLHVNGGKRFLRHRIGRKHHRCDAKHRGARFTHRCADERRRWRGEGLGLRRHGLSLRLPVLVGLDNPVELVPHRTPPHPASARS